MSREVAWRRLEMATHGVLCTVHPLRGIDAVPCVYATDDAGFVGVPIATVKEKSTARLQREVNLDADPRASLLVESWDPVDWSRLWWVRVELRLVTTPDPARIKTIEDSSPTELNGTKIVPCRDCSYSKSWISPAGLLPAIRDHLRAGASCSMRRASEISDAQ
jgi:Pyridoxamine 5'-phosphate oxidase